VQSAGKCCDVQIESMLLKEEDGVHTTPSHQLHSWKLDVAQSFFKNCQLERTFISCVAANFFPFPLFWLNASKF